MLVRPDGYGPGAAFSQLPEAGPAGTLACRGRGPWVFEKKNAGRERQLSAVSYKLQVKALRTCFCLPLKACSLQPPPPIDAHPRDGYHGARVAPVAQLDRVLPSEGRGRGFESRRMRHIDSRFESRSKRSDKARSLRAFSFLHTIFRPLPSIGQKPTPGKCRPPCLHRDADARETCHAAPSACANLTSRSF